MTGSVLAVIISINDFQRIQKGKTDGREKKMFNRQSIHIALLLWGCIFSLLAALCMFMSRNFDREKRKWLIHMQLASALLLCSDAFAWGYRGNGTMRGYYMVRLSNFLVFLLSDVILLLFHGYLCYSLFQDQEKKSESRKKNKNKRPYRRIKAVCCIGFLGMFLVIVSQFTDLYYYFDAGNIYHRSPLHSISLLIPMVGMLLDLSLLIQYRDNLSRQIFVSMLSYIALPFTATVILIFYYGISLINLAISISVILMFVTATMEQNEKLAMQERENADLRISIMMSQIAPHFIYNTLTSIQVLCEKDPKAAKETVENFSRYLRGNLESLDEKEPIPFLQELEHMKYYLAIEKKRFGDRIRVEYDIQENDFQLPCLSLQPIVENAVKHGICKKKNGGTIRIASRLEGRNVYLTVSDDGVGFDTEKIQDLPGQHIGVKNVENRIRNMCGGHMKITSVPGIGTEVVMILPGGLHGVGEPSQRK